MEENDTDPTEQVPCTNDSGLEDHTQDHAALNYVGIEAVLDQMRRKAMKTGFEFNIMVVGKPCLKRMLMLIL